MRNIAFEVVVSMEKKQIRFFTGIQKKLTKKGNNDKKIFEAGRAHERKKLVEILQRERDRAQSLRSG